MWVLSSQAHSNYSTAIFGIFVTQLQRMCCQLSATHKLFTILIARFRLKHLTVTQTGPFHWPKLM